MKRPILLFLLFWGFSIGSVAQSNANRLLSSVDDFQLNKVITPTYKIQTVVLDPGHGGKDSGCLGKSCLEKDLVLDISKRVAKKIRETFPDIRVILTREKDVFVPLHKRAEIANKNKADLFISIHCNAIENADHIRGSETYVMGLHTADENLEVAKRENAAILLEKDFEQQYGGYDPNSPEGHIFMEMYQNTHLDYSLLLADKIEKHMSMSGRHKSRGVRQAGFLVLRATAMPSVLVESGYLTNYHDHLFLITDSGQEHVSNAIFEGFCDYKREVEGVKTSYEIVSSRPSKAPATNSENVFKPTNIEKPSTVSVSLDDDDMTVSENESQKPVAANPSIKNKNPEKKPAQTGNSNKSPNSATNSRETEQSDVNTKPATIAYKVQIGAYSSARDLTQSPWGDIDNLEVHQENKIYKYLVSGCKSYEEAQQIKLNLQEIGFSGAFIVAYRDEIRISVQEALRFRSQAQN